MHDKGELLLRVQTLRQVQTAVLHCLQMQLQPCVPDAYLT